MNCRIIHEIVASELNALGEVKNRTELEHVRNCNLYTIVPSENGECTVISTPLPIGVISHG